MKSPDMSTGFLKALLYGAPGTTKTRTAASATFVDALSPVLVLESAGNPLSIRDYDPMPTVISMESMKDFNLPYDYLVRGQPEGHQFEAVCDKLGIKLPKSGFETVVVDGLSEVQRFAFRTVIPGRDALPGDLPSATEIQHFNSVLAMMVNWAYKFIKLDMNVILTSLEAEKQDKTGNIYRRPLLWGQSQGEIASYVYMVMRLTSAENMDSRTKAVVAGELEEVKKSQTVGFVRSSSSFYAKEQYGMYDGKELMRYMFDPTIQKIWDCIQSGNP